MCDVKDGTDRFRIVDEEAPTSSLKTEGERFIKFLSEKQLSTTVDVYRINQSRHKFQDGSTLPLIPENVTGLSCLDKFQKELNKDETICITETEPYPSTWSKISSDSCSEFISSQSRNFEKEATALKPDSLETKLLAFYMKNHKFTKKEESQAHKDAFNEIIKINDLHSFDVKSQYDIVKTLRKQQLRSHKPKKKVLKNYSKTLWDVKRCTKYKEEKQPKVYTCTPDQLLQRPVEIVERIPSSSNTIFISSKQLNGFYFPRLSDNDIQKMPQFKDYSRGEPSKVIFIKNLHKKTTESQLIALLLVALKECGISDDGVTCKLLHGRMQGSALISFKGTQDSSLILECLNGCQLNGRPIVVQFSNKTEVT